VGELARVAQRTEHYSDRAALLLEGKVARTWNELELAALREQGADALEEALASVALTPSGAR
jgi:hypothetical protein